MESNALLSSFKEHDQIKSGQHAKVQHVIYMLFLFYVLTCHAIRKAQWNSSRFVVTFLELNYSCFILFCILPYLFLKRFTVRGPFTPAEAFTHRCRLYCHTRCQPVTTRWNLGFSVQGHWCMGGQRGNRTRSYLIRGRSLYFCTTAVIIHKSVCPATHQLVSSPSDSTTHLSIYSVWKFLCKHH